MKKVFKMFFVFVMVVVLSRIDIGGKFYLTENNKETHDISQAKVFPGVGEAYALQCKLNVDWFIETIN